MRNSRTRRWVLGAVLLGAATTACSSHAPAPAPAPVPTGNYDYTNATTTTTAPPSTTSSTPTETTSVPLPPTTPVLPFPSAPPLPTGKPGQPRGAGPTPADLHNPDAVSAAFIAAGDNFDTAIDLSPSDAQVRSAVYATPSFAAQLRQPLPRGGGTEWANLAAHHGYTTVALTANKDDGRPPDTATTALRSWRATQTGYGDGGWSAPLGAVQFYVTLTRASAADPWQVASVMVPTNN